MAPRKKDHLVQTALDLFDRDGFTATGIDKILAAAGVAKMTLYNNFKSKDQLIVATLQSRDLAWRAWFEKTVEELAAAAPGGAGANPSARLTGLFDALEAWFNQRGFRGCIFQKASAEFPARKGPIRAAILDHKMQVFAFVRDLCEQAGAADPIVLAGELYLLMEGAIVSAQVTGDRTAALRARQAAEGIISGALA